MAEDAKAIRAQTMETLKKILDLEDERCAVYEQLKEERQTRMSMLEELMVDVDASVDGWKSALEAFSGIKGYSSVDKGEPEFDAEAKRETSGAIVVKGDGQIVREEAEEVEKEDVVEEEKKEGEKARETDKEDEEKEEESEKKKDETVVEKKEDTEAADTTEAETKAEEGADKDKEDNASDEDDDDDDDESDDDFDEEGDEDSDFKKKAAPPTVAPRATPPSVTARPTPPVASARPTPPVVATRPAPPGAGSRPAPPGARGAPPAGSRFHRPSMATKNPKVNLSDKDLTVLDLDWDDKAEYVTEMVVSKNTLRGLPKELGKLQKLEVLDISCNRFVSLTEAAVVKKKDEEKEEEEKKEKEEETEEGEKEEIEEKEDADDAGVTEDGEESKQSSKEDESGEEEQTKDGDEDEAEGGDTETGAGVAKEKAQESSEANGDAKAEEVEDSKDVAESPTETNVLFDMKNLKALLLSGNRLTDFGNAELWKNFSVLEKVDLENNKLTTIPEQLAAVGETLASLNLSRNLISTLPSSIASLKNLMKLNLEWNELTTLPDEICGLQYVQELILSNNRLMSLPESIDGMTALVRLEVEHNQLTAVPVAVGRLAYLASLSVRDNCISALEEELFTDESFAVESVNFQANRLESLPESLWAIDSITELNASSNRIGSLPPAVAQLFGLKKLNLADNCIEEVPEEIGTLADLAELSIAWNKVKELPDSIGKLLSLQHLNVSYNELSALPELTECEAIYELWVTGNRAMTSLPDSVYSRPALGKIYASMLQLTEISENVGQLEELEVLDVAYNEISVLPESIGDCQILRRINLCRNKVKSMPSLSQNYDMQNLDLSYNQFEEVPEEMEQYLERGVEVLFDGNPILEKGEDAGLSEKVKEEVIHIHASSRFPVVGIADMIGKRPTMEDAMAVQGDYPPVKEGEEGTNDFYGLYDGHAGRETATFCGQHVHHVMQEELEKGKAPLDALIHSYPETNRRFKQYMYSDAWCGQSKYCGTTAVSVLIDTAKKAYLVNVGDSRAVLCRQGKAIRLSHDHKPYSDEEQNRIRALGGCVAGDTGRVNGLLAVSRSIGDFYMHPYVTDAPFSATFQLEEDDDKLILACDGVWDEVSDERAAEIVMQESDPFLASAKLRDYAYALASDDNISVMIIRLR